MSETNKAGGGLMRAGRAVAGALFTRSGAGWARPRRARRLGRLALIGTLAAGGAAAAYAAGASQSGAALPADRAAIEAVVHNYILENPEIITEAMKRLQAKQVAQRVDSNRMALETPHAGAWEGAAKPEVTLVAFMDYACGYCRASLPDMARLLSEDPGLRIVYRELPVITQGSVPAARVSLYAAEAGKFPAFHRAMFAQGGVETDQILAAAKEAGLDVGKVRDELDNAARNSDLSENIRLAQALEGSGTPLFVIGDQVLYGAIGYDGLKAAIAEARKAG